MGCKQQEKSYDETLLVRILACVDSAAVWVEIFVGGKCRNGWVNHENNENQHPIEITRYTVYNSEMNASYRLTMGQCMHGEIIINPLGVTVILRYH